MHTSPLLLLSKELTNSLFLQRVVVLKDQQNKKEHESSAQVACEAAGAIRTVASLTREDDCCNIYSKSLEEPLKRSNRTAFFSNLIFSFSQAVMFFVISLVFWFGARGVADGKYDTMSFFVCLFVRNFMLVYAVLGVRR